MTDEAKKYLIIGVVFVLAVYAAYSFGVNRATESTGLDPVRADIQRVIQQQQDIIAGQHTISTGLDTSAKRTAAIESRIAGVEGIIGTVAGRVNEGGIRLNLQQRLIDEGQSIIGRGTKENQQQNQQPATR